MPGEAPNPINTFLIGCEKPISRVLFRPKDGDNHLSWTPVAGRLERHYPEGRRATLALPYLVLLHVGFTQANRSPGCWCALTAPFHPYRSEIGGLNFYGTVPKVTLAGRYPAHCPVELGLSSSIQMDAIVSASHTNGEIIPHTAYRCQKSPKPLCNVG